MAKAFKELVEGLTEEQLNASATLSDVIEVLKAVDELAEVATRLQFQAEEQKEWTTVVIATAIDYNSLYFKAISENLNYEYNHEEFAKGFEKLLKERLESFNKLVKEHEDALKNL